MKFTQHHTIYKKSKILAMSLTMSTTIFKYKSWSVTVTEGYFRAIINVVQTKGFSKIIFIRLSKIIIRELLEFSWTDLEPFLYILYNIDPSIVKKNYKINLFVDNITLTCKNTSYETSIKKCNEDLIIFHGW